MSLTRISFAANPSRADKSQTKLGDIREGFRQLLQSIKDGSLIDAQQAYSLLTDMMVNAYQILSGKLKEDYIAIGQALRAGNIAGARRAVSELQVDLQNIRRTGHHHGQNVAEVPDPSPLPPPYFSNYLGNRSTASVGTHIDITV